MTSLIGKSFRTIFKSLKTIRNKEKIIFVGEDKDGTRYYEAQEPHKVRKLRRYYEKRVPSTDFDVVDLIQVPPAWDAWLRYRRQDPPTEEELKDSDNYYKFQQELAAKNKKPEPRLPSNQFGDHLPKKRSFPKLPSDGSST